MSINAFRLHESATLSFTNDLDEFKGAESIHFPTAIEAVRHAVEKLSSDRLWTASIIDAGGTRIGVEQIRSIYQSF